MFQEAALFPWLTARGNVELALKLARRRARRAPRRAPTSCSRWCTSATSPRSARTSSRAACANGSRSPARSRRTPRCCLMDEPFGALDAMTRDRLHDELETVWRETRKTVIFVTHNVREAVRLGDRVVLLASRPGPGRRDLPRRHPAAPPHRLAEVATLAATITDRLRAEVVQWPLTSTDARPRSRELRSKPAGAQALARGLAQAARRRDLHRRVAGRRVVALEARVRHPVAVHGASTQLFHDLGSLTGAVGVTMRRAARRLRARDPDRRRRSASRSRACACCGPRSAR